MVDIRNVLRKLTNSNNSKFVNSELNSGVQNQVPSKITPAEMELARLREQERLDNVKQELKVVRARHKFLQPKFQDSITSRADRSIVKQGSVLANTNNPFSLGRGNTFLGQRSNLFFGR